MTDRALESFKPHAVSKLITQRRLEKSGLSKKMSSDPYLTDLLKAVRSSSSTPQPKLKARTLRKLAGV